MTRDEKIAIAKETIKITEQGFYTNTRSEKISFGADNISEVLPYSPETSDELLKRADEIRDSAVRKTEKCVFAVYDSDSFEAAKRLEDPLVMNFASARKAGGGFLTGASAQEESLCRASTLYASIGSEKAQEMYNYNAEKRSAVYTDFMLISPNVYVFRDRNCRLLNKPFKVAVVTIAAPNKNPQNGPARNIPKAELDNIMKTRLRKMLCIAIENGYKNLVLGAWGCGVFGNDPRDVARLFCELFFDEYFEKCFENVTFAIMGRGENLDAFNSVFGKEL